MRGSVCIVGIMLSEERGHSDRGTGSWGGSEAVDVQRRMHKVRENSIGHGRVYATGSLQPRGEDTTYNESRRERESQTQLAGLIRIWTITAMCSYLASFRVAIGDLKTSNFVSSGIRIPCLLTTE